MNEHQEDRATNVERPYPQLNLNTGVSVTLVIMLAGLIFWSAGIKSNVDYHEQRIVALEAGHRDLHNARFAQAQAETKLEGRLVGIEGLLRDMLTRISQIDRRSTPPSIP